MSILSFAANTMDVRRAMAGARAVVVVTIGVRGPALNIGKPQSSRMM
jgi:hypothetical protein